MRLPIVTRNTCEDLLAAKDEIIAALRQEMAAKDAAHTLAMAGERKRADDLHQRLLEMVERAMAAPVAARTPRHAEPVPAEEDIPLWQVNPNDTEMILRLAERQVPPNTKTSATMVMRMAENIKRQVIQAHAARQQSMATPGYVQAPSRVQAMIDEADRQGAAQANRETGA